MTSHRTALQTYGHRLAMKRMIAAKILPLAALAIPALISTAHAEAGHGYVQFPGVKGETREEPFTNWVPIQGRYWGLKTGAELRGTGAGGYPFFSAPFAPRSGPGELILSVDKRSPALASLLAQCARKAPVPAVHFAESADDFRSAGLELGDRPDTIPAYFQYDLKNVAITACPVEKSASEQAFILKFNEIAWLNYDGNNPRIVDGEKRPNRPAPKGEPIALTPASLPVGQTTGEVRTFVVSWLGFSRDATAAPCPVMSRKPLESDFGLKPAAAEIQDRMLSNPLEFRGAGSLNVCLIPGAVADPGNPAPQTKVARGLNLDGDDGSGKPPAGVCKHHNYAGENGEAGIDNQFYSVAGCIPGLQGAKGLWQQVLNEEWRSGTISLLIQISGIDNDQNDDQVDVSIYYSEDDPAKDPQGKEILPDYTFRPSDKVELTHYFRRLPAKIVNGVISTEPAKSLTLNMVKGPALRLADARMQFRFMPDGNLKGMLGGYQNWRYLANYFNFTGFEITFGFQCPAFYGALKRAADGMQNPATGDCDGISTAYDIEAIPAFLPNTRGKAVMAGNDK